MRFPPQFEQGTSILQLRQRLAQPFYKGRFLSAKMMNGKKNLRKNFPKDRR